MAAVDGLAAVVGAAGAGTFVAEEHVDEVAVAGAAGPGVAEPVASAARPADVAGAGGL